MKDIYLTGIKPTGEIHLGNYIGAIKPSVKLFIEKQDSIFLYFIADYHSLNFLDKSERKNMEEYSHKILASYIACGLDPAKVNFYKQSSIKEIFELQTILSNFTSKSLLNLAHAYKSKVDTNKSINRNDDENINMGIFNYPLLMASDILIFNANYIPVGLDQKQHIEIVREIARKFNFNVKKIFNEPEAICSNDSNLVGLDGRKMSKSYNNTIPLFSTENQLITKIKQIETDSKGANEPKDLNNNIMNIFKHFGNLEEISSFENDFLNGINYHDAKLKLFKVINQEISPKREIFFQLIKQKSYLNDILHEGAKRISIFSQKNLEKVKKSLF